MADTSGTWIAGKEGPAAMIMPASPRIGDVNRPETSAGLVWEEVAVKAIAKTVDGPRGPCPERWLAASSTTTEPSRTRSSPPATASSTPPTRETWRHSRSPFRPTLFPARPPPSSGSSRAAPTASFGSSGPSAASGHRARSPACGRRGSSTAPKAWRLGLLPRPVERSASSRGACAQWIRDRFAHALDGVALTGSTRASRSFGQTSPTGSSGPSCGPPRRCAGP